MLNYQQKTYKKTEWLVKIQLYNLKTQQIDIRKFHKI